MSGSTPGPDVGQSAHHAADESGSRPMPRLYTAVVVVELLVLAALWAFSRYYGA